MDYDLLEKLLELNGWAHAFLRTDLSVADSDDRLLQLVKTRDVIENAGIMDLFPEVVGLESVLGQIAAGQMRSFILPRISRDSNYYDLIFLSYNSAATPLLFILKDVTETAKLQQQINQQRNEINLIQTMLSARAYRSGLQFLGQSAPIQELRGKIDKIAQIPSATVLLLGESGTGKSMAAQLIHKLSHNAEKPFVEINCAAIPETLLEAELFGYEKGAFTGALQRKSGLLEEADGGTLFLDEICDMPLTLQAKLLTFLEKRHFRRLGSTRETSVRIRLIAATHRDLDNMIRAGEFRSDLAYRLNVVTLLMPPLRSLGRDILDLANQYIQHLNKDFGKQIKGLERDSEEKLLAYHWPGNVRELRNTIERAMIFAERDLLDVEIGVNPDGLGDCTAFQIPAGGLSFEDLEKQILQSALKRSAGNRAEAARLLRMTRDTFRYRLKKYKLT